MTRKKKTTNIQPKMMVDLMRETEPDFFSGKLEPIPVTVKEYIVEDAWWDAIK